MASRNVSLTPPLDRFIDDLVGSGQYQNASEVVREALRRLADEVAAERQLHDLIGSMIDRSDANIAAGHFIEVDDDGLEDLIASVGERAGARLRAEIG